jgi:hypothetical protein
MKVRRCTRLLAAAALTIAVSAPACADDWRNTMVIYVLGAGIDGTTQVGPVTADIDQSFSDILEKLDLGLMGSFAAQREELTLTLDAIYIDIAVDHAAAGIRSDVELTQTILALDAGYLLNDLLEVIGGLRYNSLDLEARVTAPFGATAVRDGNKDWVDPYVGLRTTLPFNDQWSLTLRGDIGGFSVGSELAWQAVVRLNWTFSPNFLAMVGYRVLDTDYEDGSGASLFRYDVTMSGPMIGFGWRF